MEIVIISALSMVLIFCAFITGLHYGSIVRSNALIEMPNPVKKVKEHKETKKQEEQKAYEDKIEEINLYNIDAYDGSALGQKSFPDR